ncbi:hypothetical protein [Nostoc sp.]|uniref:hypothetical protein n=1 Tax=Nostoc sp. TaxID=1180 RepID=UPI002FFBF51B
MLLSGRASAAHSPVGLFSLAAAQLNLPPVVPAHQADPTPVRMADAVPASE